LLGALDKQFDSLVNWLVVLNDVVYINAFLLLRSFVKIL